MKITNITRDNKSLSRSEVIELMKSLVNILEFNGYFTTATVNGRFSKIMVTLKICNFALFKIKVNGKLKTPPWTDKVKFNDIINSFFDTNNISATVTTKIFKVRKGLTKFNESNWIEHLQKMSKIVA